MSWLRITRAEDIPLREGRAVLINGTGEIAIFNLGGKFVAVSNTCPHRGGPLADGIVCGDSVICPLHAWKVCLSSGNVTRPQDQTACVKTYPVKVADGIVLVDLAAPERAEAA